jgi:uncharacterized membrane protein YhaH (DUF805 family)
MSWWLSAMKKYFDFSGRAPRKEYWMYLLFNFVFGIVALVVDITLSSVSDSMAPGLLYSLFCLAVLLPALSVTVRRLHDVGKSGWWILISVLPFIGGLWLLILTLMDSQSGPNRFGESPKLALAGPVQQLA